LPNCAFAVELPGDLGGFVVGLDDGVQRGVQALDPIEVALRQLLAGELAEGHQALQFGDVGFDADVVTTATPLRCARRRGGV